MFTTYGQEDSTFIRSCFNTALSEGKSYSDLRELCKKVGARLSGSVEAEMAVEWAFQKLNTYGFDRVYKQEIMVPHWERGTKEAAWIKTNTGELIPMKILALGGSVGTQGSLRGELIVFKHLDELIKAKPKQIQDKIVLIDQKMNEQELVTFHAYGGCYQIRRNGAVEAAKLGAKAVLIRSLALPTDDHPHTGSMHYDDKVTKIPAAALSTRDCELIASQKGKIEFIFEMDCRVYPDAPSHNVIAEIKGSSNADQIITFGGHLDSWDAGEGAHDDGAGVVHCIEALRILKELGYRPKHTLRLVLFMNEENGNFGGKSYAKWVHEQGEKHAAALESDRGGFVPRGFACDGDTKYVQLIQSFSELLKPYGLHDFGPGYGGVDISPLKNEYPGIPLFGFVPDSQRYFDFHHAESDVFEAVNQRELELGCASMAAFLYLLDKNL
ncbi:MAG: M20/M25/M40 family metallo-hydrolase [Bacteroidetes bacterium]|nr:MAG: M20/M25/M40 family metallo-hydrolase [Bacteroidota bacterium]